MPGIDSDSLGPHHGLMSQCTERCTKAKLWGMERGAALSWLAQARKCWLLLVSQKRYEGDL